MGNILRNLLGKWRKSGAGFCCESVDVCRVSFMPLREEVVSKYFTFAFGFVIHVIPSMFSAFSVPEKGIRTPLTCQVDRSISYRPSHTF